VPTSIIPTTNGLQFGSKADIPGAATDFGEESGNLGTLYNTPKSAEFLQVHLHC
jgi:hypothetical protein